MEIIATGNFHQLSDTTLNMATMLKALLNMMAHDPDARNLLALRSFAAQGWELSRGLAELLASFEGDATNLARGLLAIQAED